MLLHEPTSSHPPEGKTHDLVAGLYEGRHEPGVLSSSLRLGVGQLQHVPPLGAQRVVSARSGGVAPRDASPVDLIETLPPARVVPAAFVHLERYVEGYDACFGVD